MTAAVPRWRVLVLHGPNLNLLGEREPERYGRVTLDALDAGLRARAETAGAAVECVQSNHEGVLLDALHVRRKTVHGVIVNPGGLTHTSVSLRDALVGCGLPAVECHLTNTDAREGFRRRSLVAPVCVGRVLGFGAFGYSLALDALLAHLDNLAGGA